MISCSTAEYAKDNCEKKKDLLNRVMRLKLSDIMDLDYLLAMDEHPDTQAEEVAARDRDIFRQLDATNLSEKKLILSWLDFRKLIFFDPAGSSGFRQLPGQVFSLVFAWAARGLSLVGGVSGMVLAYAFLAYHGTRPVNVALFFCVFVLVPAVLFLLTLAGLGVRYLRGAAAGNGVCLSLVSGFLFHTIPGALEKILKKSGKSSTESGFHDVLSFIRSRKQAYGSFFFWPLMILLSLFALFFSLGALGGTLFRVAFSDVAFGWQSTLAATPSVVHDLVSLVSLPWAAWMPDALAGPTPAQVEGSRIILKQGIAALATEHLVSWWPFLCLSMVCYALIPRLLLISVAVMAQRAALNRFEFHRPRFRRLLVRMKSPVMDIRYTEAPGSRFKPEKPPQNKGLQDDTACSTGPDPSTDPGPSENAGLRSGRVDAQARRDLRSTPAGTIIGTISGTQRDSHSPASHPDALPEKIQEPAAAVSTDSVSGTPVVVLALASVWDRAAVDRIRVILARQFLLDVRQVIPIGLDLDADTRLLGPDVLNDADPIIFLQEVWQPPIRGILHYLGQLKQGVLQDKNLWVLLTRAPEEKNLGVPDREVDATVWQDRILGLGLPDLLVERIRP
jgi:hypothetical protein